jgi:hypothetical protein
VIKTNDVMKRLTLDIETKAHIVETWGLFNQNVGINQILEPTRMISFAAKWLDNPRVDFYSEFHHGRDAMVRAAFALVDEADAVIHYNGKGFDMKHLNREFKEHDVRVRDGLAEGELPVGLEQARLRGRRVPQAGTQGQAPRLRPVGSLRCRRPSGLEPDAPVQQGRRSAHRAGLPGAARLDRRAPEHAALHGALGHLPDLWER